MEILGARAVNIPPTELQRLLIKAGAEIKATPNPGSRNSRGTIQLKIGPYCAQTTGSIDQALIQIVMQISGKDFGTRVGDKGK
jgi:hypothetical protein